MTVLTITYQPDFTLQKKSQKTRETRETLFTFLTPFILTRFFSLERKCQF